MQSFLLFNFILSFVAMGYFSQFKIQQGVRQLAKGKIIAYPTEAVYGLGCHPLNEQAVLNLLELKQRSVKKGLILIAANFEQLAPFVLYDDAMLDKILPSWKEGKAITWIMPVQSWVPGWLTGEYDSLAVRVTAHPLSKALCEQFKMPIVSTSANPSNKKPALNARQVRKYFAQNVEIIVGDTGGNKNPSKIYNALTDECVR